MPNTKKPVSQKQLAANRANAVRSTGPRSPEGKARSAQNARKHGFAATSFAVVRLEDVGDVGRLREDLIACYKPVNSQELFAIERIAIAQQALLRAARLENGMFTSCLNESIDGQGHPIIGISPEICGGDMEITKAQTRNYLLAEGFHRLIKHSESWRMFLRYQSQTERLYRRALEDFERLKALRSELPNEPILEAQPEQNADDGPDENELMRYPRRFAPFPDVPSDAPPVKYPPSQPPIPAEALVSPPSEDPHPDRI